MEFWITNDCFCDGDHGGDHDDDYDVLKKRMSHWLFRWQLVTPKWMVHSFVSLYINEYISTWVNTKS